MAELFMECEEEELEPWQKRVKEVEEDDDDDEPIFIGEISSSKPASTCKITFSIIWQIFYSVKLQTCFENMEFVVLRFKKFFILELFFSLLSCAENWKF